MSEKDQKNSIETEIMKLPNWNIHPYLQTVQQVSTKSWYGVAYSNSGVLSVEWSELLPDGFAELPVAVAVVGEVEVELLNPDAAWFKLARVAARPTHMASHKREQHH